MHLFQKVALAVLLLVLFLPSTIYAATPGPLEAGAARIDITPSTNAIPKPYTSILDHIYARAIYLQNGRDRAVLLNADVGATTAQRTHINRPDEGNARCKGSRVRGQPSDFCPSTPPPTTSSTSSATSSQQRRTGHSEPLPCRRGARSLPRRERD